MEPMPGVVPRHLVDGAVSLLRAEDRVFEAMVNGWRAQQLARGLATQSIRAAAAVVSRFQTHTNEYPWRWTAHHVDEFRTGRKVESVKRIWTHVSRHINKRYNRRDWPLDAMWGLN